jgi:subtilisin family serine protease
MKTPAVLGVVLLGVSACQDATSPRGVATRPPNLPAVTASRGALAGDYIVTFRADESDPDGQARALVAAHGGAVTHVYRAALKGFAVSGLPDAAVQALSRHPRVAAIEPDGIISIVESGTQTGATWGLDRIDQRTRPLNGTYGWDGDGTGVTVYILDTGIRASHNEFGGRVSGGFTAIGDGNGTNDCHGHGTHVAGTVGGATYGVAKAVSLVPVRVLGCGGSGPTSGVIAGVDWVRQNKVANSVANMSLGGSASTALNSAVANAVGAGVTFAVAAGNENTDACTRSPAGTPAAITVGSTTSSDSRSSFSNWGTCVDINAPGSSITSAYILSNSSTATMSGTSMASPHVAGAAAIYLSLNSGASPAAVTSALTGAATPNVISNLGSTGTPNLLLYTHFAAGPAPDPEPDPDPVVAITGKVCTGFSCTFTATSGFSSYSWTFGDGDSATTTDNTATNTYPSKGTYSVTVSAGGNTSAPITVSCNPKRGCK